MAADDTTFSTRVFAAGRASFVVRCASTDLRDTIENLFGDLPTGDETADTAEMALTETPDGEWNIRFADEDRWTGQPADWCAAKLITDVSRLALDADPDRLHLHAAALALDGKGVLISAESGTGKTTLAVAMARRGWTYVSDEMVAFEVDDRIARGFAKPLSLKPGGHALLPGVIDAAVPLASRDDDEPWVHLRASSLAPAVDDHVEPAAIVILQRLADAPVDVERLPVALHPVDAVVALMSQTMDPGRFGPDAVTVLARLAARCRCVALAVGPIESSVAAVASAVESSPDALDVRVLAPPPDFDLHGWTVPANIRSVVIGQRVVVHDTSGGAIVAFDESGTAVWEALHGSAPAWWSADSIASTGTAVFLEALEEHGLLERSSSEEGVRS